MLHVVYVNKEYQMTGTETKALSCAAMRGIHILFISCLGVINVFALDYFIFSETDSCFFFSLSLKAYNYTKPVEKSFNCLQEINKVSIDGKRIIFDCRLLLSNKA